jgi:hypothetical protein
LLTRTSSRPQLADRARDRRRRLLALADVGLDRQRGAAGVGDLGAQLLQPVGTPRHQGHRGAALGEGAGRRLADAARGPGHQGNGLLEVAGEARHPRPIPGPRP